MPLADLRRRPVAERPLDRRVAGQSPVPADRPAWTPRGRARTRRYSRPPGRARRGERGDRRAELVDLPARVVEVVLACHRLAAGLEDTAEQVADERAPRVADGQRPGRVRRDELDIHPARTHGRDTAPRLGRGEDRRRRRDQRVGPKAQVEEARRRDLRARRSDPRRERELGGQRLAICSGARRRGRASFIARFVAKSPCSGFAGRSISMAGAAAGSSRAGKVPASTVRSHARATASRTCVRIGAAAGLRSTCGTGRSEVVGGSGNPSRSYAWPTGPGTSVPRRTAKRAFGR